MRGNFFNTSQQSGECMDSYYAPAVRASKHTLEAEIEIVDKSPVVGALLHSVSGLLAVVNEQRQVIALNNTFLAFLGIKNPTKILGLRPGEVIDCIHAFDEPAGCGTTRYCSSCGAAIAMVTSLNNNETTEKICALSANRNGKTTDLALLVKAHPVNIDKKRFLLLFLQDITRQEQHAALERTFFHDINNSVNMLVGISDLLNEENPGHLADVVHKISLRLVNEITLQRCLSPDRFSDYKPVLLNINIGETLDELQSILSNHPVAGAKKISIDRTCAAAMITSNQSILLRILCNMAINALEATEEYGEVKIWVETNEHAIVFCVWNNLPIPHEIMPRIFQRYFSTKAQTGRGIGTYSMKLFGERYLGGKVNFSSTEADGTVFRFSLPVVVEDPQFAHE
jgi:signal transduction histidine kinase